MLSYSEGGSIPFLNMIQEKVNYEFYFIQKFPKSCIVATGVAGPNSNAHGPNEMLHIPYTKKLVCCLVKTLYDTSIQYSKK